MQKPRLPSTCRGSRPCIRLFGYHLKSYENVTKNTNKDENDRHSVKK